ncbi:MAG: thioredoxin-dependent thiol peroxidase [Anaerolineae bacterium]|nr:thioredoxin-dependent thiol peroxidase [Anaerolineae bacterium]
MLEANTPAPEFTLISDEGKAVSLSDFQGKKVIIYFYPKADTPGCTKQACAIRDQYAPITESEVIIIGISPDEPAQLVKFREKYALPFILLSDPDHAVAEAYGAWGEKNMYGKTYMGIIRSHFAVDEAGHLIEAKLNVKPLTTADLALKIVGA